MAEKSKRRAVKKALTKEVDLPIKTPDNKVGRALSKKRRWPLVQYFSDSWSELKKVTWPNRRETIRLVFAVIVFTTVFTIFMSIADFAIGNVIERVLL